MISEEHQAISRVEDLVKEFNQEVKAHRLYYKRKNVETTQTIFFDRQEETLPAFRFSSYGWCTIPSSLASFLEISENTAHIISYKGLEEEKLLKNNEFIEKCRAEVPQYLKYITELYLDLHYQLIYGYAPAILLRVKEKLDYLKESFHKNASEFFAMPSIIQYISKEIKIAKGRRELPVCPKSYTEKRNALIQKVLQLRKEGVYSVKDICSICKISYTTYYLICRREDRNEWPHIRPKGRPYNEDSLQPNEKAYIRNMADTPYKSYTVPEMCAELGEKYHRNLSRKMVYTYLSRDLGYTFKRNTYAAPSAFKPGQVIVRYKVCKVLVDYWKQGKSIMYIDESGFDLGIHAEYSYAKKGLCPYRVGITRAQRLNLIMAITNKNIFAYQIRKGAHNEHSFIAFILDIAAKIYQLGSDYVDNIVFYMDNHKAHTSTLAIKLFKILGVTVIFSPIAYYQLNPLELLLGIIKRRLKNRNYTSM